MTVLSANMFKDVPNDPRLMVFWIAAAILFWFLLRAAYRKQQKSRKQLILAGSATTSEESQVPNLSYHEIGKGVLTGGGADPYGQPAEIFLNSTTLLLLSYRKRFPYRSEYLDQDAFRLSLPWEYMVSITEKWSIVALGSILLIQMKNGERYRLRAKTFLRKQILQGLQETQNGN